MKVFLWLLCGFSSVGIAALRAQVPPECEGTGRIVVGAAAGIRGDIVQVDVTGEVACEVSGFIVAIGHDKTVLRFQGATPGPFLTDYAGEELFFRITDANQDGYAVVGAIFDFSIPLTVPPVRIESGTLLAKVSYEILGDAPFGDTPLLNRTRTFGDTNLISNIFAGNRGEFSIAPELVDGSISIQSGDFARFKRGDSNADDSLDLSDATFSLNFLFSGGQDPPCHKGADANDDGSIDLSDALAVLNFLFGGAGSPPDPFAACGFDETTDELTCVSYAPCGG